MKTKEEFLRAFADELRGLLAESFAEARHSRQTDHAANGHMIVEQLRRGQSLLERMYEFMSKDEVIQTAPLKVVNGAGHPSRKVAPS